MGCLSGETWLREVGQGVGPLEDERTTVGGSQCLASYPFLKVGLSQCSCQGARKWVSGFDVALETGLPWIKTSGPTVYLLLLSVRV